MEKQSIISYYQLILKNRVSSWKNGEIMNCEYEEWVMDVFHRLQGLGLSEKETVDLINQAELQR